MFSTAELPQFNPEKKTTSIPEQQKDSFENLQEVQASYSEEIDQLAEEVSLLPDEMNMDLYIAKKMSKLKPQPDLETVNRITEAVKLKLQAQTFSDKNSQLLH